MLTFKKALFAGVLDGGEREVFLGGSRLSRFMETVEKATAAIGESADIGRDGVREAKPHVKTEPRIVVAATPRATGPASGWAAVVQTGVALLEQLAAASHAARDSGAEGLRFVHRDPQTGEDYVRIPVPSPEVLDHVLQTIVPLVDRFRPTTSSR